MWTVGALREVLIQVLSTLFQHKKMGYWVGVFFTRNWLIFKNFTTTSSASMLKPDGRFCTIWSKSIVPFIYLFRSAYIQTDYHKNLYLGFMSTKKGNIHKNLKYIFFLLLLLSLHLFFLFNKAMEYLLQWAYFFFRINVFRPELISIVTCYALFFINLAVNRSGNYKIRNKILVKVSKFVIYLTTVLMKSDQIHIPM